MKFYPFMVAKFEDIEGIVDIERNFFEKGVAYTADFIKDWMQYNPNMFYVVKDQNNVVKAFAILVPITEACYKSLKKNELIDMNEFKKEDVLVTIQSEYYYFADIAATNKEHLAAASILNGIQKYLCRNAHFVATTPITNDGERVSKMFGFGPEVKKGKNCFLEITPEVIKQRGNGFERKRKK